MTAIHQVLPTLTLVILRRENKIISKFYKLNKRQSNKTVTRNIHKKK